MAGMKEIQEKLAADMRRWQKIEDASVASTGRVMEETENPIIRLVMEVIQRDSQMHHRVQEWIADTLEGKAVTLSPDELAKVWGKIEDHIKFEKQVMGLAEEALASVQGSKGLQVQAYLLQYLLEDEKKHNFLLEQLESIKKGMYPYS